MLSLYLSMALMSLKLWELAGLIGGVLLVVCCQVIFMIFAAYFIVFRLLGSNYDAAVMCAGLCGHGLGATPSAIVNMTAVTEKYGMSHRAFYDCADCRRFPGGHHLPAADHCIYTLFCP